ncbi:hypothetical protein [Glycomyces salinus]|uniref:hypothetical protein n=1 Tax=Glycomyces salinus TaxID=980294 RepID=UPI0018ECA1FA|nr:hypothetical protein [Glycomyces salinus]
MTRAGTALAAALAVVALAAGCTSEAEPEPPIPTDDRPFGPAPDYEDHSTSLMTAASDKDIETLCADLETALGEAGLDSVSSEAGDQWCGHLVDGADSARGDERSASGEGAAEPVRVHAWSDGDTTHAAYFDPAPLLVAVDSEDESLAEHGTALSAAVAEAVTEATGTEPEEGPSATATYTEINSEVPAEELAESLAQAAEPEGLRVLDELPYEEGTATLLLAYEGEGPTFEDRLAEAPEAGMFNPVPLHVWADDSGNGVISYFDPMPLSIVFGEGLGDVGTEMSTALSETAWAAALPQ